MDFFLDDQWRRFGFLFPLASLPMMVLELSQNLHLEGAISNGAFVGDNFKLYGKLSLDTNG